MIVTALILGVTGSLHCVGMCGPIALLINGRTKNQYLLNRVTYHAGRTITYSVLGLVTGLLGKLFSLGGVQSILSLIVGGSIIVILFLPRIPFLKFSQGQVLVSSLKQLLSKQLHSQRWYATLLTGLLNGFLPCGLVYSALALALVQSSWQESVSVMTIFGLSTMPALLLFTYSSEWIKKVLPFPVARLQRVTLMAVAVLMIWRGIIFSWPEVLPQETSTCHSKDVVGVW